MIPQWLEIVSLLSLGIGILSAIWMAGRMVSHPPHMAVMAFVWPLCALFAGPVVIWFQSRHGGHMQHMDHGGSGSHDHHMHDDKAKTAPPSFASVAKGTLHCGAGCTLADLIAESVALVLPGLLTVFGWHWLFADRIFASWVFDYILALMVGIAFQYFAIAPMRGLGLGEGLKEAAKADVLSLSAWQIGMYGAMAIAHFGVFGAMLGAQVDAGDPLFWFAMQIAMVAGFCTALPVNRWLIAKGIKEAM